ncbi:hypothetical protein V8C86DRAFT_3188282, partial [Haematococcus lacustris]
SCSVLDNVLSSLWEDCASRGLFRYDVTACPSRVIPGRWGFVAQLNEGRASKKRPTEIVVDQVCQPFDPAKFHFGKAVPSEALLQFESIVPSAATSLGCNSQDSFTPQAREPATLPLLFDSAPVTPSSNLVLINVSPIEYGHVLLVPRTLQHLPQQLKADLVLTALHFAHEAGNPHFNVGYNSLGAYATINHLHFQAYFLGNSFPCQSASSQLLSIIGPGSSSSSAAIKVSTLIDYPVRGFVMEALAALPQLAAVVGQATEALQASNVPFNMLITDKGTRVFLWPQCYAERQAAKEVEEELLATGVNPAVFEVAGHMVLKRAEDYQGMQEDLATRLLSAVSLPADRFQAVADLCFRQPWHQPTQLPASCEELHLLGLRRAKGDKLTAGSPLCKRQRGNE